MAASEEDVKIVFEENFQSLARFDFAAGEKETKEKLKASRFDLIVLDLRLLKPEPALELVREIRANQLTENTPIIILSPTDELILEMFNSGVEMLNFFWEPFEWVEVVEHIKDILSTAD